MQRRSFNAWFQRRGKKGAAWARTPDFDWGRAMPPTLVRLKCCTYYKISWIFTPSGLLLCWRQNAPNSFCAPDPAGDGSQFQDYARARRIHCDLWTFDCVAYRVIMLECSLSFTLVALLHLMCIYDVLNSWMCNFDWGAVPPPTLVWNKMLLNLQNSVNFWYQRPA